MAFGLRHLGLARALGELAALVAQHARADLAMLGNRPGPGSPPSPAHRPVDLDEGQGVGAPAPRPAAGNASRRRRSRSRSPRVASRSALNSPPLTGSRNHRISATAVPSGSSARRPITSSLAPVVSVEASAKAVPSLRSLCDSRLDRGRIGRRKAQQDVPEAAVAARERLNGSRLEAFGPAGRPAVARRRHRAELGSLCFELLGELFALGLEPAQPVSRPEKAGAKHRRGPGARWTATSRRYPRSLRHARAQAAEPLPRAWQAWSCAATHSPRRPPRRARSTRLGAFRGIIAFAPGFPKENLRASGYPAGTLAHKDP